MKALIVLTVAHLCLESVLGGGTCGNQSRILETACEYPSILILVSSPGRHQVDSGNCNSEYKKSDWQEEPTISYPDAKPEKTYTLVNIDPDPPSYNIGEYYLHWLVSNIKGEDLAKGDLSKANHLKGYYGPAPPKDSGIHRYMFLIYEEGEKNKQLENPEKRSKFGFGSWLEKHQHLCGPLAGVQFRTQF